MDSAFVIDGYFDESTPQKKVIPVLVVMPQAGREENSVRAAQEDNGSTRNWVSQFHGMNMTWPLLPKVVDLVDFVQNQLTVPIDVREYQLKHMSAKLKPKDPVLLPRLFECTDSAPCVDLYDNVLKRIIDPVGTGTTDKAFISFWDDMIRHVLDAIYGDSDESDRGASGSSSTGSKRPDFLFTLNDVCVFRGGEYAAGAPIEVLRRELCDTLIWSYGDVSYLLAYAAVGLKIKLYALVHEKENNVGTVELGSYDLRGLGSRIRLLLALLNLRRTFQCIADNCADSKRLEFQTIISCRNGVDIYLIRNQVEKVFPDDCNFALIAAHLKQLYDLLRAERVPKVDCLVSVHTHSKTITFEPRDMLAKPSNLSELFRALRRSWGSCENTCGGLDASRYSVVERDEEPL